MNGIPPILASILQAPEAQRRQAAERDRDIRRAADARQEMLEADDQLGHHVEESADTSPSHGEGDDAGGRRLDMRA